MIFIIDFRRSTHKAYSVFFSKFADMRIRNALLPIIAAVTLWACSDPSEGTGIHTSGGKTGQDTEYKAPDYADD